MIGRSQMAESGAVPRRSLAALLGVALLICLGPVAAANAAKPVAKFKLLSMSGREEVTFQEQETDEDGSACTGTTEWTLSYRSTKPVKLYVFLKTIKGKSATVLSPEAKSGKFTGVPIDGEASVSLRRDYTATNGCTREPEFEALCPDTAEGGRAEVYVAGNLGEGAGSIRAGVTSIAAIDTYCTIPPLPLNWGEIEFEIGAYPLAVSRKELLGKKKRIQGSASDEVGLVDSADGEFEDATATGLSRGELSVTLKRLKLKAGKAK